MAMECLIAIGTSIVEKMREYAVEKMIEYAVAPIGRQLGYLFFCESNITNLKTHIQELKASKQDLDNTLVRATNSGEEIKECAKNWLRRAETIIEKVANFEITVQEANTRWSSRSFPNLLMRHRLSRNAKEMAISVCEIIEEKGKLKKVSYVPHHQNINLGTKGYTAFESRNLVFSEVIKALGDDNIRMIGVCGMPGVGKTTLVREVGETTLVREVGSRALKGELFSDAVVVTVSQTPNLQNIQKEVAARLGLELKKVGVNERAIQLRYRLRREEKFLIILDDVWKKLDLLEIGIHFEDHQKGCKILLSSRYQGVLENDMCVDKNFKVEVLSESEAQNWFSNIVGGDLLSDEKSEFKDLATKIVKKCAGLPLATITVAHALKNKRIHCWKDAWNRLQRCSVDKAVFSSVKLSYEFLENAEAQNILLFCSLREEDAEISTNDLLDLCIGWSLFQGVYTLEEARNRLQTLLDELKAHCLLLNGNYDADSVMMHDVIRLVVISIASQDFKMYNITSNDELKEHLDNHKLIKESVAISLDANYEDQCLPSTLNCPQLRLLSMRIIRYYFRYNEQLRNVSLLPDNFFEVTNGLRVLNLSYLCSKSLPSSFRHLQNLQALHLVGAELEDIYLIGELKKLKVLDLSRSSCWEKLPEQIGQLTCLLKLDLSYCQDLKVVPPNVIYRLKNLEELNMMDSFRNWKDERVDDENRTGASLREVMNLTKLTALYLDIPKVNMLPEDLFSTELKRYNLRLGYYGDEYFYSTFGNCSRGLVLNLESNKSSLLKERGFERLLKRSEKLFIEKFNGFKNIVYQLDKDGLSHLNVLEVHDNDEIQYIIDSMEPNHSDHSVLPSLETFEFVRMDNLEKICHGKLRGANSLGKLRQAEVRSCPALQNLLPFSIANQLEEIKVDSCLMMEEIVTFERLDVNSESMDTIEFPHLKCMELKDLPHLTGFCSECDTSGTPQGQGSEYLLYNSDSSSTLFNQKVAFPSLEALELGSLQFKRIWADQLPQTSHGLNNLRKLKVERCNSLKYLLSFAIARSLVQLEELDVSECESMEEIIVLKEPTVTFANSDEAMDIIEFPKLKRISLEELPQLIQFCSQSQGKGSEQFADSVSTLFNRKCDTSSTPQGQGSEYLLYNSDSSSTLFNQMVSFPSLEALELGSLQFKRIWADQLPQTSHGLNNLKKLKVERCNSLKYLLSFAIARSLVQFEVLDVSECESMEEIIVLQEPTVTFANSNEAMDIIEFPKLKKIRLENLPRLIQFCFQSPGQGSEQFADSASTLFSGKCDTSGTPQGQGSEYLLYNSDSSSTLFNQMVAFPSLEALELGSLQLKRIWADQLPQTSHGLNNLRKLNVKRCNSLKYLLSLAIAKSLVQLEELDVSYCEGMEEIIVIKQPTVTFANSDEAMDIIEFPKLKRISLEELPQLIQFCSQSQGKGSEQFADSASTLFNRKVAFPSLEALELGSLQLKRIWADQLPQTSHGLNNLRKLNVKRCNSLKYLLSLAIAKSLVQLEELDVSYCEGMEEIIVIKQPTVTFANSDEAMDIIEFPKLKRISLEELPQLIQFCSQSQGKGSEQFADSASTLFNRKVAFPSLEALELGSLQFKRIWADQLPQTSHGLNNLRKLKVERCNSLKYLLSFAIATSLVQLKELDVTNCEGMEEIIVIKESLQFKKIWADQLPQTSHGLNNLRKLKVERCNSLKYLLSFAIAKSLVQLEVLDVSECESMEEIIVIKEPTVTFANSDEAMDIIEFPKLKRISLEELPQLIQFCSQSQGKGSEQFADSASTLFNRKVAFPSLEALELGSLQLKRIWADQLPQTSHGLNNLRNLKVKRCNSLKYLLSFAIVRSLVQLEELDVSECESMEETITIKEPTVTFANSDEAMHIIEFPKLKKISLVILPQLIQFCSQFQGQGSEQFADSASTFFNRKVAFPSLEYLALWGLNYSIKRIWPNQLPETSKLHNLEDLSVWGCNGLKYVLPFAIAESLVQLNKLSVDECEELEEIIMIKEPKEEVEKIDKKLLPKLKELELSYLPNLARFCSIETNIICGLNFKPQVEISDCPKLLSSSAGLHTSFPNSVQRVPYDPLLANLTTSLSVRHIDIAENILSASLAKSFVHLRTLDVSNCKLLKEVVVSEESGDGIRSQKICFPALKHLELYSLRNLKRFCAGDHFECLFLETLCIKDCFKLRTFISNSTDEVPEETDLDSVDRQPLFNNQKITLPMLRKLRLVNCNSVVEIWDDDTKHRGQQSAAAGRSRSAFQSLEFLQVFKCGRLNKLLEANSSVCFETLTVLEVLKCKRMEYLFTPSAAKTLVLLKMMAVSECQAITEIIASSEADHDDDKLLIASFQNLEILVLDSLPSLTSFHMGNCAFEFPKLRCVAVVGNCPELRSFCGHGTITTPSLQTFVRRRRTTELSTWSSYTSYDRFNEDQYSINDRTLDLFSDRKGDDIEQLEEGKNIDINATIQQFWEWENHPAQELHQLFQHQA